MGHTRLVRNRRKSAAKWRGREALVTREEIADVVRAKGEEIPEGSSLSCSFAGGGLIRVRWASVEERYGKANT